MRDVTKFEKLLLGVVLAILALVAFGQNCIVSGAITDSETGEMLPATTVLETGTTGGAATNIMVLTHRV